MADNQDSIHIKSTLRSIIEKVQKYKYAPLNILCKEIRGRIVGLKAGGLSGDENSFVTASEVAMAVIENHVRQLTSMFLPYLQDARKKEAVGHDCTKCSGACVVKHDKQFTDLQTQIKNLKKQVIEIVDVTFQIYKTVDHDRLEELNAKMISLYQMASGLLYEEEGCLLPDVAEAPIQKTDA